MSSLLLVSPDRLVQIEIHVTQIERAKTFYEKAFGWRPVPAEIHNYIVLEVPRECPWGVSLVPSAAPRSPSQMILYFSVDDAARIAELAEMHGGSRKFGPTKLSAYGSIWQVADPDGNRFGLFEKQANAVRRGDA